jgi:hypothetical protein
MANLRGHGHSWPWRASPMIGPRLWLTRKRAASARVMRRRQRSVLPRLLPMRLWPSAACSGQRWRALATSATSGCGCRCSGATLPGCKKVSRRWSRRLGRTARNDRRGPSMRRHRQTRWRAPSIFIYRLLDKRDRAYRVGQRVRVALPSFRVDGAEGLLLGAGLSDPARHLWWRVGVCQDRGRPRLRAPAVIEVAATAGGRALLSRWTLRPGTLVVDARRDAELFGAEFGVAVTDAGAGWLRSALTAARAGARAGGACWWCSACARSAGRAARRVSRSSRRRWSRSRPKRRACRPKKSRSLMTRAARDRGQRRARTSDAAFEVGARAVVGGDAVRPRHRCHACAPAGAERVAQVQPRNCPRQPGQRR